MWWYVTYTNKETLFGFTDSFKESKSYKLRDKKGSLKWEWGRSTVTIKMSYYWDELTDLRDFCKAGKVFCET